MSSPAPAAGSSRKPSAAWLTDRDRDLLGFIAEQPVVLATHVQALLDVSAAAAARRLRALERARLLSRDPLFYRYPPHYRIERAGLKVVGSGLPVPKRDLDVRHDVGVAWLWLAARRGVFGPLETVISERHMRSHDGVETHARGLGRSPPEALFGIALGGHGQGGRPRLHYPDLLLVDRQGRRIAVELELSSKGRARRERIIGGYAADGRIDAVLYLVPDKRISREVQAAARRFGYERRLLVQPARLGQGQVPEPRAGAQRAAPARAAATQELGR